MTLSPGARKAALTAHVTSSVGWLGAVVGFLALGIVGVASRDAQMARSAYLAMEPLAWFVVLPFALASLLTGLVQSLGTTWGVFRHYWVLFKLVINVFATIVLLLYMQTLGDLADAAAEAPLASTVFEGPRSPSPVLHAGAALLLLLVATTLAVYKPRGMTRYGRRKQHEQRAMRTP